MRYYLVLQCGHGLTAYRRVFSPHVGDTLLCHLCRGRRYQKVVAITAKRVTGDGETFNE